MLHPTLYWGAGDLNSGPHVLTADTFRLLGPECLCFYGRGLKMLLYCNLKYLLGKKKLFFSVWLGSCLKLWWSEPGELL